MCALCHLVEVLLLISITASAYAELVPPCSGHGVLSNDSSGVCECDLPYQGEECELCAQGFYGDASDLCYLDCSTGIKLLSGFPLAGVGVAPQQFGQASLTRLSDFCIAVIAPGLERTAESAETLSEFLNSSSLLPELSLTLQFQGDAHSPCMTETVLIYKGLPEFLVSDSLTEGPSSFAEGRLLASFTGDQLISASLTIEAAVVAVVYHRSSPLAVGFNLTVSATAPNETTAENQSVSPNKSSADAGYCSGRYHHTMVYDPCSQSLWLYGGRGLSGGCGQLDEVTAVNLTSGEVRGVEGEGLALERRYLHSAALLPCSPSFPSSRMLVFGGFTDGEGSPTPSGELWQFNQSQWTQLTSAPPDNALAGHSAVMAGDEMIVVGGVGAGLRMSPRVLRYDPTGDSWEILTTGELGPAGLYGHSAVYDAASDSVLVFGGFSYARSLASPSPALYSLHLGSLQWTLVQTTSQPPARVFHSAALVGGYLALHGGLVEEEEGGGACASGDVTLVTMDTTCLGRSVVNLPGEVISGDPSPLLWGHAAAVVDGRVLISGGFSSTALDSVAVLSLPDSLECPLARTDSECLDIPNCAYCQPTTETTGRCYNASVFDAETCNGSSSLGPRDPSCDATLQCQQFATCRQCLSADTAQFLGCLWCGCNDLPGICIAGNSASVCPCNAVGPVNSSVCYLDTCESPSCQGCMESEDCRWIGNTVEQIPNSYFMISISRQSSAVEWGCYSTTIQNAIMSNAPSANTVVNVCPPVCNQATSCESCVRSHNPNAGNLTCVWASYTQQCVPPDMVPLLCSDGTCGAVITNASAGECPLPAADQCSAATDCLSCLRSPRCGWLQPSGEAVWHCRSIDSLQENLDYYYLECPLLDECEAGVDSCGSEQICRDLRFGHECSCLDGYRENGTQCVPICTNDCSGQGQCVALGNCSCDLGFLGEDCGIACLCNGHSDCLDSSPVGRMTCLQCLHNTQGPSCGECLPFHVGSPRRGSGCVPCLEYCHGNSELCLREEELRRAQNLSIGLSMSQLLASGIVMDGPSEAEATCQFCAGESTGDSCETCNDGYFRLPTPGTNMVNCVRCRCNGHGDTCNPADGTRCNCQNNTMTPFACPPPCFDSQCSTCMESRGYRGTPVDSSQCYKTQPIINTVSTFNLSASQTAFLAVPPISFLFSDINVRVTIELEVGMMDVYVTDADQAIRVTVGGQGEHVVSIRSGFDQISAGAVEFLRLSDSVGQIVHHTVAENRLVVVIPFTHPEFQSKIEYFTFFAKEDTKFHFYYRQDPPRLNLVVFFSVFLSSFCMVSSVTLLVWKLFRVFRRRRRAVHRRHQRQLRANRPFESIRVFFDTSLPAPEFCWELDSRCRKPELKKRRRVPGCAADSVPTLELAELTSESKHTDLKKSGLKKRRVPQRTTDGIPTLELAEPTVENKRINLKLKKRRDPQSATDSVPTLELAQPTSRTERMSLSDCGTSPIAVQPTRDGKAVVSTVLIQLPSHGSLSYAVCTGSTLVDCSSVDGAVRKRTRLNNRNKCTPAKVELQSTPL